MNKSFSPSPAAYEPQASIPSLALRPREAAMALGISERTLFDLAEAGVIPSVRLTSKIRVFPVDVIRRWLAELASEQAASNGSTATRERPVPTASSE